jgi:hypothetical protein
MGTISFNQRIVKSVRKETRQAEQVAKQYQATREVMESGVSDGHTVVSAFGILLDREEEHLRAKKILISDLRNIFAELDAGVSKDKEISLVEVVEGLKDTLTKMQNNHVFLQDPHELALILSEIPLDVWRTSTQLIDETKKPGLLTVLAEETKSS